MQPGGIKQAASTETGKAQRKEREIEGEKESEAAGVSAAGLSSTDSRRLHGQSRPVQADTARRELGNNTVGAEKKKKKT